jgi:hypothetical protein
MSEKITKKWEDILQDFHRSHLSVTAYAREHHISKTSLYKWAKHLGAPLAEKPLTFVEIPQQQPSFITACEPELFSIKIQSTNGANLSVALPWIRLVEFVKGVC